MSRLFLRMCCFLLLRVGPLCAEPRRACSLAHSLSLRRPWFHSSAPCCGNRIRRLRFDGLCSGDDDDAATSVVFLPHLFNLTMKTRAYDKILWVDQLCCPFVCAWACLYFVPLSLSLVFFVLRQLPAVKDYVASVSLLAPYGLEPVSENFKHVIGNSTLLSQKMAQPYTVKQHHLKCCAQPSFKPAFWFKHQAKEWTRLERSLVATAKTLYTAHDAGALFRQVRWPLFAPTARIGLLVFTQ